MATLKNVQQHHTLAGTGQVGILMPYPNIVQDIKNNLADYCRSGISVNFLLAQSVILAQLQEKKPELLESFKCRKVNT